MKKFCPTPNEYFSTEYKCICANCKKEIILYTQKDNNPEYYTTVYYKCECGNLIEFLLPVN